MSSQSPLRQLEVVRVNPSNYDPAVDGETAAITKYIQTRDMEHLKFLEDKKPIIFVVERLPLSWLTRVLDNLYPIGLRQEHAFRAAVHFIKVGNTEIPDTDLENAPLVVYPEESATKNTKYRGMNSDGVVLSPESFAQAVADKYGTETVMEIGSVAIGFARLPVGKKGPFALWGGSTATI